MATARIGLHPSRGASASSAPAANAADAATSVMLASGLTSGVITDMMIQPRFAAAASRSRERNPERPTAARWMTPVLVAAGVYNLAWGALAIIAPLWCFRVVGMEVPNYPELWQCIGMIVGVYGIGYLAAATDPLRHWPIVLVGLAGKILGPIGFAGALLSGRFPLAFGWNILTNDLVWWIPFAGILWAAWHAARVSPAADGTRVTVGAAGE